MQNGHQTGNENDLEQRCADDDIGRHAQQVDHGRDHDEAAADTHDRGEDTHQQANATTYEIFSDFGLEAFLRVSELVDTGRNLDGSELKEKSMLQYEYAREALKNGLAMEAKLGTNPYKFGMVGATDSHTGLATAQEDNFFGKHSGSEPSAERLEHVVAQFGDETLLGWEQVASGLAAVWAAENTREALFDAMRDRQCYATTGERILIEFSINGESMGSETRARAGDAARRRRSHRGVPTRRRSPASAGVAPLRGWWWWTPP